LEASCQQLVSYKPRDTSTHPHTPPAPGTSNPATTVVAGTNVKDGAKYYWCNPKQNYADGVCADVHTVDGFDALKRSRCQAMPLFAYILQMYEKVALCMKSIHSKSNTLPRLISKLHKPGIKAARAPVTMKYASRHDML
jgi:hypothetical protein